MSSRVYQNSNEYFSSRQSFEAELREAFLCGMKQGRSEGYNQGFLEGEQQGYREGYQVGQTKFRSILAEEIEEAYTKGNKTGSIKDLQRDINNAKKKTANLFS